MPQILQIAALASAAIIGNGGHQVCVPLTQRQARPVTVDFEQEQIVAHLDPGRRRYLAQVA